MSHDQAERALGRAPWRRGRRDRSTAARIDALQADPERSRRLSVNTTGSLQFLTLGTNRAAGAIADVRVGQAVNYAIDKAAYRDAIAGQYAAAGELASTIMVPGALGYRPYDLYPTLGGRGHPAKARALLAEAGYPDGLTLSFAALGGRLAAGRKPIRESLARAEIDQRIMRDAPMVPLMGERYSFQWASRVHGWRYDPWSTGPDLTAVWLDPPSP